MATDHLSRRALLLKVGTRLVFFVVIMMGMFFGAAGTFRYWHGWVYMGVVLVPFLMVLTYLIRKDPALLERRMQMREKEQTQKKVILFSLPYTLMTWMFPGFDVRFGWSNVPVEAVVVADVLVFLGYGWIFLVFRENSFASRTVQVEAGQTVVSTGPYGYVRHPMYSGVVVMYLASPIALGSWWAVIPAAAIVPMLVVRIRNEEAVLTRELDGYGEYLSHVKYRLLPGVW